MPRQEGFEDAGEAHGERNTDTDQEGKVAHIRRSVSKDVVKKEAIMMVSSYAVGGLRIGRVRRL